VARLDPRVRVVRNERNLGLASSLNKALEFCGGELIGRMDGDDRSLPDRLDQQVTFLFGHPEVDVLGGGAIEVSDDGRILGETHRRETHDELVSYIYRENPFIHPTVMARRRFWVAMGGYAPQARLGEEDYDLWLRGHSVFRYHNLQQPLIYYRRRPPSFTRALCAARVLWRSARREARLMTHGWYALRPLFACAWLALYKRQQ
jgi:glycosyltransferase involved in cell wall biosynthesis